MEGQKGGPCTFLTFGSKSIALLLPVRSGSARFVREAEQARACNRRLRHVPYPTSGFSFTGIPNFIQGELQMLCKKRVCFFLLLAATVAPALLGCYSSLSSPKVQADGGAPPPPPPWPKPPSGGAQQCAS